MIGQESGLVIYILALPLSALEKEMATHSSTLPGKFQGWRSLVGYSPWDRKELDTTEQLHWFTECSGDHVPVSQHICDGVVGQVVDQSTALRHLCKPSVPGIVFQSLLPWPVLCRIPRLVYSQLRNAEELIPCGTTLAQ